MRKFGENILTKIILYVIISCCFNLLPACSQSKNVNEIKVYTIKIEMGKDFVLIDTLENISSKQGTLKLIYEIDSLILNDGSDSLSFRKFKLIKKQVINDSIEEYVLLHNCIEVSSQIFYLEAEGIIYYRNFDSGKIYRIMKKQIINSKEISTYEYSSSQSVIDSVRIIRKQIPGKFIDSGFTDSLEIDLP